MMPKEITVTLNLADHEKVRAMLDKAQATIDRLMGLLRLKAGDRVLWRHADMKHERGEVWREGTLRYFDAGHDEWIVYDTHGFNVRVAVHPDHLHLCEEEPCAQS